MPIFPT